MASDTVIDLVSSSDEEAPADPPAGNASTSSRKRRRSGSNEAMQQSGEKMNPAKKMRIKLTFSRKGNPHRADRSGDAQPLHQQVIPRTMRCGILTGQEIIAAASMTAIKLR